MTDILELIILDLADLLRDKNALESKAETPEVKKLIKTFLFLATNGVNKMDETLWHSRPELDFNYAYAAIREASAMALGVESEKTYISIADTLTRFESEMDKLKEIGFLKK